MHFDDTIINNDILYLSLLLGIYLERSHLFCIS